MLNLRQLSLFVIWRKMKNDSFWVSTKGWHVAALAPVSLEIMDFSQSFKHLAEALICWCTEASLPLSHDCFADTTFKTVSICWSLKRDVPVVASPVCLQCCRVKKNFKIHISHFISKLRTKLNQATSTFPKAKYWDESIAPHSSNPSEMVCCGHLNKHHWAHGQQWAACLSLVEHNFTTFQCLSSLLPGKKKTNNSTGFDPNTNIAGAGRPFLMHGSEEESDLLLSFIPCSPNPKSCMYATSK